MSEPNNNGSKDPLNEKPDMVLTIRMQPDGLLGVDGPGDGKMYNEPMCFWLLELAKDHIKFNNKAFLQSRIVKPNIMNRVKGAFGKCGY